MAIDTARASKTNGYEPPGKAACDDYPLPADLRGLVLKGN
jgi:hypothetical protein